VIWAVFGSSMLAGAVTVLLFCQRPPTLFVKPPHARVNFRGRVVVGTLGVVLLVPLALGAAAALTSGAAVRMVVAVTASGTLLGIVGLADDVYGDRRAGGLIGHARALVRGRVTTGTAKAFSGVVVGLAAAWVIGWRSWSVVIAGAVIALSAHMANLLDVRPARTLKVWLACFVGLAVGAGLTDGVLTVASLAGGAAGFLEPDLRERGMLGDTGSGILGGSLGAAAAASLNRTALLGCLAGLAVLTVASEFVSFTQVIERVAPLRFLDSLGRPP